MKIILSPAKRMREELDFLPPQTTPVFLKEAQQLKSYLQTLPFESLKKLLSCNDAIASLNYNRYAQMDLHKNLTSAILAYDGIQYQYMAPQVFEEDYFSYVQEHVRILSGLYGILRPLDGVVPYRLEMQARLKTEFCKNLYDYWKDSIYQELTRDDNLLLDLTSHEYRRAFLPYLQPQTQYYICQFGEWIRGKIMEKGVYVKMARGEMVRYMAEHRVTHPKELTAFHRLGFVYHPELSTDYKLVFLRETAN